MVDINHYLFSPVSLQIMKCIRMNNCMYVFNSKNILLSNEHLHVYVIYTHVKMLIKFCFLAVLHIDWS